MTSYAAELRVLADRLIATGHPELRDLGKTALRCALDVYKVEVDAAEGNHRTIEELKEELDEETNRHVLAERERSETTADLLDAVERFRHLAGPWDDAADAWGRAAEACPLYVPPVITPVMVVYKAS